MQLVFDSAIVAINGVLIVAAITASGIILKRMDFLD